MTTYKNTIKLALNWLTKTPIYNKDSTEEREGGICATYNLKTHTYTHLYTEITAYAIELFLYLYKYSKNESYLQLAKTSTDWILNMTAMTDEKDAKGSFSWKYDLPNGPVSTSAFSFDVSICTNALIDMYNETKEKKYLKAAKDACRWLFEVMRNDDFSFKVKYDWNLHNFSTDEKSWYLFSGCLHTKIAISFAKLFQITNEAKYKEYTLKTIEWGLSQQKADGSFRVNIMNQKTFAHPHCYALEGMLYAYLQFRNKEFLNASIKAAEWLIRVQETDGGIRDWHNGYLSLRYSKSSGIAAQAIRTWVVLHSLTKNKKYLVAARNAANFLQKMQCRNKSDSYAYGGFFSKKRHYFFISRKVPHIYSWMAIFTIHALSILENYSLDRNYSTSELSNMLF